jgi:hypothetical protein
MASAGVVGYSEVIVPNSATSGTGMKGTPAMWSMVWVGLAVLFLVLMHLAMVGRASR